MTHPSNKVSLENLSEIFSYHDEEWKLPHYKTIRTFAKQLAVGIIENTPECADQSAALRKLREVVMTANAAIALCKEEF